MSRYEYVRRPEDIYRESFRIIRRESSLARFQSMEERVVVRMIHTAGDPAIAGDVWFKGGFAEAASCALAAGATILCDATMVASGVTRSRLSANNRVRCLLQAPGVERLARRLRTTRSAAALELWRDDLEGAVVAIGNAPTALFHLLEMLHAGAPRPAAVIGLPVGFVGAAESKQALCNFDGVPSMGISGRRGGSAMAVAAINALACEQE